MGSNGLLCLFLVFCSVAHIHCSKVNTYRAAIFEISPVIRETLEETIEVNLKTYEEQITEAAQKGVQIIAFPEYGMMSMHEFSDYRETAKSVVPEIEDPRISSWNPCDEPTKYKNSEVLRRISCSAKANSIFVLINILNQRSCIVAQFTNSTCRSDGVYLHNSNVVFASNGSIVALYHKTHLFFEEDDIDPNPTGEPIVFDAGFAKFGTFVCWDLGYSHPSIQYIKELGIRNLIYSTAWGGELPFLTSLQLFNAWARGLDVNLIASNLYLPDVGRLGSAIFSSSVGALNYTFDLSTPNRLIIADVPLVPGEGPITPEENIFFVPTFNTSLEKTPHYEFTNFPTSQPTDEALRVWYENITNYDYVFLDSTSGNVSTCEGNVCCDLEYRYVEGNDTFAKHALLIKDGTRSFGLGKYHWSIQICAVVRCETSQDSESCGRVPKSPAETAHFSQLKLTAKLNADLLFPHIAASNFRLPPVTFYDYSVNYSSVIDGNNKHTSNEAVLDLKKQAPLSTFGIYGKFYDKI